MNLKAGQKTAGGAEGRRPLRPAAEEDANVGTSERWLLDVVTPEQLRAMLEAREVVLRWRFKAIVEEVTQTRDVLLRTRFGQTVGDGEAEKKSPAAAGGKDGQDKGRQGRPGQKGGQSRPSAGPAAAPYAGVESSGGGRWSEGAD